MNSDQALIDALRRDYARQRLETGIYRWTVRIMVALACFMIGLMIGEIR